MEELRSSEREAVSSIAGRTNTQGLILQPVAKTLETLYLILV